MPFERASDVGFCVADDNADLIANALVRRLRDATAGMEAEVNRLYRGRNAIDLNDRAINDLERTIKRLGYMAETLREIGRAETQAPYSQAAE